MSKLSGLPGIIGLMVANPRTASKLNALAETLLRPSEETTLTHGERELIFATASWTNDCRFCSSVHSQCAVAAGINADIVGAVERKGIDGVDKVTNPRLHALLAIAAMTAAGYGSGLNDIMNTPTHHPEIDDSLSNLLPRAAAAGATEEEIHDTVLIAASACMFNRYVDALTPDPQLPKEAYAQMGRDLTTIGYTDILAHNAAKQQQDC